MNYREKLIQSQTGLPFVELVRARMPASANQMLRLYGAAGAPPRALPQDLPASEYFAAPATPVMTPVIRAKSFSLVARAPVASLAPSIDGHT